MSTDTPRGGWISTAGDPWYRLGAWLFIYGGILGAPAVAVTAMLALASAAGVFPLPGEFYVTAALSAVSIPAVAIGWFLMWQSRRRELRMRDIDELYWS